MMRVFLQSPLLNDMIVLSVAADASAEVIRVACIAALPEHHKAVELFIFDEADLSVEGEHIGAAEHQSKDKDRAKRLHIGRCKHANVKVRYAGNNVERQFSPAATIEHVKNWAVKQLQITKHDANELSLQLIGSDVQPARDQHVGIFVDNHCSVGFDLIRSYTVNGDSGLPADKAAILAYFKTATFLSGEENGRWGLLAVDWPAVYIDLQARDGQKFTLRLTCDGYPAQAPTGAFWDYQQMTYLPATRWPRAGVHRGQALKADWQGGTALYIPCDRQSINGHDQWRQLYPAWLWDQTVGLTRYLNVVSELLNGDDYVGPPA